jgi:gliding motility-associated-like protein
MKNTTPIKLVLILIHLLLLSRNELSAQITINNTGYTPTQLVNSVLVPSGSGTVISNVVFQGVYNNSNRYQVGQFSTAGTTLAQLGFTSGVVLTTGHTSTIPLTLGTNPGSVGQMATAYTSGTPGELRQTGTPAPVIIPDLDVLAGASNYFNGTILEFDFVPVDTKVQFRYIFGSEEYSDQGGFINYNCSSYNDKFGFLISGPGIAGGQGYSNNAKNIARLANGSEVSINSVNNGVVGSSGGSPSAANCLAVNGAWVQNTPTPEFGLLSGHIDGTQLNGNTKILTASQTGLTPGQTYHIKLIVTDVNDATYDSVVYLEAGSFSTTLACAAGPDQTLCSVTATTLAATSPATGTWSIISGSATFANVNSPTSGVTGLSNGVNVLRWTASDLSCFDEVSITVNTAIIPTFTPVVAICSGGSLSALPTTSNNGINGTWSPALNNTTTTVYTFTPTAGQCATTTTLTITVNPNVTPTFTPVAAICSGGSLSALPTTSNNGINGTWSPALNNTTTTVYTFTPTAGQCATTTTLTITVNPNVTPTFTPVAAICSGGSLSALPTTSNNGINGTWSPALNNTTTTVYTFTPSAGQCATTTTLTITVNPTPILVVTCGISTATSVTFNWNSIGDATSYNYSYSINGGPAVTGSLSNSTTTLTISSLSAGQNVSITITPVGSACAQPASANCVSSNCPSPIVNPIGNISVCSNANISLINFTSPTAGVTFTWTNNNILIGLGTNGSGNIPSFNAAIVATQQIATITVTANDGSCTGPVMTFTITVNPNVTPTFTAVVDICSGGSLSVLPTTSNNGINGAWSPALNNTTTTVYTFTPTAGQCATTTTLTITVNPNVTPTFTAVADICSGASLSALPTTSNNGINGTWTPALNNSTTTVYTFTPTAGQCATTTTLTITINTNIVPTFTAVAAICSGESLSDLPITSNNGINGTWSPALNNTTTTVYTFTPTAGQCATTTTLTITVNPNVTPTFTAVAAICSGGSLSTLPTTSNNGINGTWSPALNNISTTVYTFTPTAGQCATNTTLTITVNSNVTPTFTALAAICSGGSLSALPTTSNNGINGTWSPALNNTTTTVYTFTPTAGQCATTTTLTVTVNSNVTPIFTPVAAICSGDSLSNLQTLSNNGINGSWSPALNNTTTTVYTFTPTAGQCANTATITITVNPKPDVTLTYGCNGTNFEIKAHSSMTNFVSYEWYNLNNPSTIIGTNATIIITQEGSYMVIVKTSNCEVQATYDATNIFCGIPKGISPNGDGQNDYFDLSNLNVRKVQIFNRYGMQMYSRYNYKNEWDGKTDSGQILPDGTYYYIIEFNSNETKTGWIYKNSEYK